MKFQNTINLTRTSIFGFLAAAFIFAGAGMLKTKLETKRENFSVYFGSNPIFQFPLTNKEKAAMVVPVSEFMRFYTDCGQKIYNHRTFEYAKNQREIIDGVRRRKHLEDLWTRYFYEQVNMGYFNMHYIDTASGEWHDPLNGNSRFHNSFNDPRIRYISSRRRFREKHEAIDIFSDTGSYIHSPVSGLIVASADNWQGNWTRRNGLKYERGGLGELSGNGIILFNPADTGYYFMIHMNDVYARTGDIVSRGEILGTIGKTGNALSLFVRPHLHLAYKKPRMACGIEGVLVPQNPYWNLRNTRRIWLAHQNGKSSNSYPNSGNP
ncbi:MAG: M23 family metallopeptidase [Nanoarchaeota archaeon]|nr:M23 family metallopeptidase [Nanoarchaeota archaeon]